MKKTIIALMLLFTIGASFNVQAQEGRIKYYYYPSQNVYQNTVTGEYYYYNTPTTSWITVKALPQTITIGEPDPKFEVYYKGGEVWKDNPKHLKKYKVKRNGDIKEK